MPKMSYRRTKTKVVPRIELGSAESESAVLTITPYNRYRVLGINAGLVIAKSDK